MDINQIYNLSNNQLYHSFYDIIELPYSFDDIKIQSNEIANYLPINLSFEKIYSNYLYLYGWTKFASTTIPLTSLGIAGNYSSNFTWYTNLSTPQFTLFNNILDNMTVILPILDTNFNFFIGCKNFLSITSSDTKISTISQQLSFNQTTTNSAFDFIQIKSLAYINNQLYVVDSINNAVFLYSIQFTPAPNILFLKTLNGFGNYQDNSKFNNPTGIDTDGNNIYILDAGNYCIKIYDLDLNWQSSYNIKQITNKIPVYFALNGGLFYIVTSDNNLLIFSSTFTLLNTVPLNIKVNEIFSNLFFAKSNTSIFYIVTNLNIYKCNIQTPNVYINKFNLLAYNIINESLIFANSVAYNNEEYIFCISTNNSTNTSKIIQFVDNNNFTSNLVDSTFDIYPLSALNIIPQEYNQDFTYNKAFYYLLLNHYELQKRIKGKFVGTYDTQNNLYLNNISYNNNNTDIETLNSFIGQNEIFSNSVINRCLQQIFNIQTDIVNQLTPIIIDSQTSLNIPVVLQ